MRDSTYRQKLMGVLWSEMDEKAQANNLRYALVAYFWKTQQHKESRERYTSRISVARCGL
jgi:DNA-binding SARP family transcriptional activator